MRKSFAASVAALGKDSNNIFITGDLGFMALENVKQAFGSRFINAGIAEQNMIGVAAGLAKAGFRVFVYSIAPFCYARPYEQIRNDLCIESLPVCLVGNGGGYAYGHMGPTHHALEDCAVMAALGVRVIVPAFDEDIPTIVESITTTTYLRLGIDERPLGTKITPWAPWRQILEGDKGIIIALGPLVGNAIKALIESHAKDRPALWVVSEFSDLDLPQLLLDKVDNNNLYIIEEHVSLGGLASKVALLLLRAGIRIADFKHRYALRYPSGRYGSQEFHRIECGLDVNGIKEMIFGKSL